jgi:hypothetical protein
MDFVRFSKHVANIFRHITIRLFCKINTLILLCRQVSGFGWPERKTKQRQREEETNRSRRNTSEKLTDT